MKRTVLAILAALVVLAPLPAAASPHTDHLRHVAHLAHVRYILGHSGQHRAPGGTGGPPVYQGPEQRPTDIVLCWNTTPMTRAACAAWWAAWEAANG